MWHPREWEGHGVEWVAKGWKEWTMTPSGSHGPPTEAEDLDALNVMGELGWELAHVESAWDFPPGIYFQNQGGAPARLYLLKRERQAP